MIGVEQIRKAITESILECSYFPLTENDLKSETNLTRELSCDSLMYVQIIVTIEDKLGIELVDEILDFNVDITLGEFEKLVIQCVAESEV